MFRAKERHGQERKERMRHIGLTGQWLRSVSTRLGSLRCGVRGAVRGVGGEDGRARAEDGVQAKL